jgi:hypothetical protein
MKSFLTILLVTSYIGVAVFGFLGMHHKGAHGNGGCIASAARGMDCPKEAGPIDLETFHLDAFRSFSLATLGESITSMLSLAFASLFFLSLVFPAAFFRPLQFVFYRQRFRRFFSREQQALIRWLALHENSPSFQ